MSSLPTRLARAIVRRYPKAWRQRYEIELVGFVEDASTGWRDVIDLARGCAVERARAFVEPEAHPTRAWMLLGIARYLPAAAFTGALLVLALVLRSNFQRPPNAVAWAALISLVLLGIVGARAWARVASKRPFGPFDRIPSRRAVACWLALFSASIVVIYWVDPPGRSTNPFGWFTRVYFWVLLTSFVRQAFDLYWPSRLRLSGQLMRIGWLREQLGWARMELQRCESLAGPGDALASGARAVVSDLEKDLAGAVAGLRQGQAESPGDAAVDDQVPAPVRRLQDIAYARSQLAWSRQQRERLEQAGAPAPVPAPPFQVTPPLRLEDVRAELARARDEVHRIEAELREAFDSLRPPR